LLTGDWLRGRDLGHKCRLAGFLSAITMTSASAVSCTLRTRLQALTLG
jgi:hypothetical protein